MQLLRMSSTASLILSMQHSLLVNPEAAALMEEDAGKLLSCNKCVDADEDDS